MLIFLGLSPLKCSVNNPLDFSARKAMIEATYPNVELLYIEDVGNNELWSKNLDRQISKAVGPNLKVVLYGSRDSFINGYIGRYSTIELIPSKIISASEIRRQVGIKSKSEVDKIMTFFYVMRYQGGNPVPRDDIKSLSWKKFGEITEADVVPSHRPLLSMLNDYFKNEILRLP